MTEIVYKDKLERRDSRPLRNHSKFNNSYRLAGTYRFGEYAPTMCAHVVPDDIHYLKVSHKVKSYTMKRPLMQGIQQNDDTFLVPLSAILPINYEKFINSPNIGEDINSQKVGTSVKGFQNILYELFHKAYSSINSYNLSDDTETVSDDTCMFFTYMFKVLVLADVMLSSGSLPSSLGCNLTSFSSDVDNVIDEVLSTFLRIHIPYSDELLFSVDIDGVTYDVYKDGVDLNSFDTSSSIKVLSFRTFWNLIHDGKDFSFSAVNYSDVDEANDIIDTFKPYFLTIYSVIPQDFTTFIDLSPFYAYQICVSHFFTNDKVDYIYSAELWRQNLFSFLSSNCSFNTSTFSWNGVNYPYDVCSAFSFESVQSWIIGNLGVDLGSDLFFLQQLYYYLTYIFSYRRSLRYVDYFTGSRTRPLAVGDATIDVSGGTLDVVDVINKKWYVRLWSQISRVGRKVSEQMKGLFPDVNVSIDWHDPIYISHSDGNIFASEVDNTSSNQFDESTPIAVTSSLHGGNSGKNINININDRYGIIMTISSFDISRFYVDGIDRSFFHVDRYDKFNPYLQFLLDQPLGVKELFSNSAHDYTFGYQSKYKEFKTRIDRAFGGFANGVLPGMLFLADTMRPRKDLSNISPEYIRSFPSELDEFFISLSGFSYGTYFHFMMTTNVDLESNRPMAYNPQIQ